MPLWGKKDTVYSTGKVNCTTAGVVTKQSGSINFNSNDVAVPTGPRTPIRRTSPTCAEPEAPHCVPLPVTVLAA